MNFCSIENKKIIAFSLAEMLIVMLILTVVLAASMPIITKRATNNKISASTIYSGVPIGTIIAWASSTLPKGNDSDKWLECNGQSTNGYPELKAIVGENVPDYRDQFLKGSEIPNQKLQAGLPNITGHIINSITDPAYDFGGEWWGTPQNGALSSTHMVSNCGIAQVSNPGGVHLKSIDFDASKSNSIYGQSTTVQPPTTTCKYLIKAKE